MKKNNIFARKKSKIAESAAEMKIIHAFHGESAFWRYFCDASFFRRHFSVKQQKYATCRFSLRKFGYKD